MSSALAAPAAAGIPVTHRGVAASFAVITGHEDPAKGEPTVDWNALAHAVDTLVVLMGNGVAAGYRADPDRAGPSRRHAGSPHPSRHHARAGDRRLDTRRALAALAGPIPLPPPVTAVIGDVVALRAHLGIAGPDSDTVSLHPDALVTRSERI